MLSTRLNESICRLRKRFNVSFWCMVYSVCLFVVMIISMVASAIALIGIRLVERATGRIAGAAKKSGNFIYSIEDRIRGNAVNHSKRSDAA